MIAEFLLAISYAHSAFSISVKIDGLIDLGPKWNLGKFIANKVDQEHKLSQHSFIRQDNRQIVNQNLSTKDPRINETGKVNNTRFDTDNYYNDYFPSLFNTDEIKHGTVRRPDAGNSEQAKHRELDDIKQKLNDLTTRPITTKRKHKRHRSRNKSKHTFGSEKETLSDHEDFKFESELTTKKRKRHISKSRVTGYESEVQYRARKVKDDAKVYEFTVHIYKQTLKVFDDIKKKTKNDKLRRTVSSLKRSYERRFGDFLRQTYNHTLRTNSGAHRVILNTIDTSNKLLQRLINHLLHEMDRGVLRTSIGAVNVFQTQVDKEKMIESQHACKKLGVCRQGEDFSQFLVDILTTILQTDDKKVKQAADALTEALKNADLDSVMDYDVHNKFQTTIRDLEMWDAFLSRAMFLVLKNIIRNKNKPIVIMDSQDRYLANKTVAFHDILGILNEKLPKAVNEKEWDGMKKHLEDWKAGSHSNISRLAENVINHLVSGLKKMDEDTKKRFNADMTALLSHLK